jgi:hypothetical protein
MNEPANLGFSWKTSQAISLVFIGVSEFSVGLELVKQVFLHPQVGRIQLFRVLLLLAAMFAITLPLIWFRRLKRSLSAMTLSHPPDDSDSSTAHGRVNTALLWIYLAIYVIIFTLIQAVRH